MGKTLTEIAEQLKHADKKVQLIYAFNGSGKTRLSREFKNLIASKAEEDEEAEDFGTKILYYNAFTEDLFYWDNDLENDTERKLKIHPNAYTRWALQEQGQDQNAIAHFQHYTSSKLTPYFSADFSEVRFAFARGNEEQVENIKISKGEESNFIWSIFYSLLEQIVDDNHWIDLAVNLAELIRSSESGLKFIITTHNPLFYNVLHNELSKKACYFLTCFEDGTLALNPKDGDSNQSFSYHLYLKQTLEMAIARKQVQKYHFMLLRNLYEKTASFLGYPQWADLLSTVPGDKESYLKRIVQFSSHRTLSGEEVAEPTEPEKQTVRLLLDNLTNNYGYWSKEEDENAGTN